MDRMQLLLVPLLTHLDGTKGKTGVLYMKDFTSDDGVASFKTREMIKAEEEKAKKEQDKLSKKEKF